MSQIIEEFPKQTPRDRISEVQVLRLFGVFNHIIPLGNDHRVTVIHGPNGVGKTIVLRMIRELFTGESDVFRRIPFGLFEVTFASGDRIRLTQERSSEGEIENLRYSVLLNNEHKSGEYVTGVSEKNARNIAVALGETWSYDGEGRWVDRRDGESLDLDEALERVPSHFRKEMPKYEDEVLVAIKEKCNVRLIGTDRLTDKRLASDVSVRRYPIRNPFRVESNRLYDMRQGGMTRETEDRTIARYSRDLTVRLNEALSAYGRLTEQLDRSLVKRLLARRFKSMSPSQVLDEFRKIDEMRRELTDLGLLMQTDDLLVSGGDQDVLDLVSNSLEVFSIYVQDMQQKLALFENLRSKVSILLGRTKARFLFKNLVIDRVEGLVFRSNSGTRLAVSDLSSGEQHEMIFFYDLLFFASDEDLILIDEPEISLHIEWQMEFLDDLKVALQSSETHALIATHSPAIAQAAKNSLIALGQ